jgi:hypothetical protein
MAVISLLISTNCCSDLSNASNNLDSVIHDFVMSPETNKVSIKFN